MYKFLTKNGQLIAFGVGLLITLIFLGTAFAGMDSFNAMEEEVRGTSNIFNVGITGALILTIICGVAMLGFGILQVATNFKSSTKGLIGLAVIVIIFFIAYSGASYEETGPVHKSLVDMGVSQGANKGIVGGIVTACVLSVVALVAFIASEIINFFK